MLFLFGRNVVLAAILMNINISWNMTGLQFPTFRRGLLLPSTRRIIPHVLNLNFELFLSPPNTLN